MTLISGFSERIRLVASGPLMPGSLTSISTRSGRRSLARATASSPDPASPASVTPSVAWISIAAARRNCGWSSTSRTRTSVLAGSAISAVPFGQVHQRRPDPGVIGPVAAEPELGEDGVDVLLHRVLGQEQLGRDRGIRPALGDTGEHLPFAGGEPGQVLVAGQRPSTDQGLDDLRVDRGTAGGHR